ncbi:hypothetical protein BDF21DRAFT_409727 [Thamnidium elegans]|uniref:Mid2 domain-containing protein n=1 Tax=Thamnidium elegans TaxID=101142 RepID=A0A8H7SIY6_9FUNG|nr:hypothetical protein INT48_006410 [Thamnidium elegans]KAI8091587.1 hypothetical protein BDF21DRAFT_409727 [Thamnidium elegans]
MRLLYLSLFLLQSVSLIKANEHLPFENVKPTSTVTIFQDEQQQQQPTNIYSSNDKKHDRKDVSTKIDIIYTTIIVATTTSIPDIYNVSDTSNPAQQQQSDKNKNNNNNIGPTSSINDPNKKSSVVDDLEKDKQALKRMSTILSLVGGLGVIAIVATIVIFTRMRSRHRKQRELDEEGNEGSTYELSNDVDRPDTIHSSNNSTNNNNNNDTGPEEESVSSISTNSNDIDQPLIEPSAPPALSIIDEGNRHSIINKEALLHNRRNVISMSSQRSAPSPSAPTAKELDAMVDEQGSSSSSDNDSHHHHPTSSTTQPSNCSRCAPSILIAPELPPPAYTPSAPPHYALPQEPIVIESPLQSRRHSSGG